MPRGRGGSRTGQKSKQDAGLAKAWPTLARSGANTALLRGAPGAGKAGRQAPPQLSLKELAVGASAGLTPAAGIALGGDLPGASLSSRFP